MERSETALRELGTTVRELLAHESIATRDIRQVRNGLLERLAVQDIAVPRAAYHGRALLLVSLLAVATIAGVAWSRAPLKFQVGLAGASGAVGDLVHANGKASEPLHFSDGSSLVLHEQGRLRVLATNRKGARVLVEDGTVDVHVVPAKLGRRWSFEAGPFHVDVTGTKFTLSYGAHDQSLSLATQEGQVIVSGACLPSPTPVPAGARLDRACGGNAPASPTLASADASPAVSGAADVASLAGNPPRDGSWRVLLAAGRLRAGLRAAERVGFEHVCQSATSKELLVLADAARLFERGPRAAFALRVLRQRFPSSPASATAAFTLGRIAFEQRRAFVEAAEWFGVYLREQPNGPLMGDAVGRLMEAKLAAGHFDEACADAERYLRRFPEGPYAAEARGILSM